MFEVQAEGGKANAGGARWGRGGESEWNGISVSYGHWFTETCFDERLGLDYECTELLRIKMGQRPAPPRQAFTRKLAFRSFATLSEVIMSMSELSGLNEKNGTHMVPRDLLIAGSVEDEPTSAYHGAT
ncbi:uncharacterized protein CLUP02_04673 [Colletotrichum lupini]|uniref:Uncharacterized protein n=1 Tax=Colletotrichum lupini TaxID=145971 RepID=A0A9Q8WDC0_9PEZI|nr:uncharacterized protein CLUP02_04673 [Colletotrichum lupini]UQC79194.1 hypothetical protein CLUP02_04673 [Colletotrichum lupini]